MMTESDQLPSSPVLSELRAKMPDDRADFGAWTSLISVVEKAWPKDIESISEVYDSFLSEFPLCYGYWKKYAEHKARLISIEAAVEVYERGVQSATYSVHLWASYCSFAMLSFEDPDDVRRLFELGLSFVGKDYLCHLLWDKYLELEYSQKHWNHLAHIYIRVLKFPTKKLESYYDSFKKLVATWGEEMMYEEGSSVEAGLEAEDICNNTAVKPSEDQELSSVINDLVNPMVGPPSCDSLKRYLSAGQHLYEKTNHMHEKIICFEKCIRRPYFHVKHLDDCQLDNWHQYLDFVGAQEDFDWTIKLHERCLIPCANYPEFWIRYVELMEAKGGREMGNHALVRATQIFLKGMQDIHLFCARVKEVRGDAVGARAAYLYFKSDLAPFFMDNVRRKANMERRLGNIEAATNVYKEAVEICKGRSDMQTASTLYVHFCQFTYMLTGDSDAARDILIDGIQYLPHCKLLLEELIRFEVMHGGLKKIDVVNLIISRAIDPGSDSAGCLSYNDREHISRSYLELVDLCGTIHDVNKAWTRHIKLFPHLFRPTSFKELVFLDNLMVRGPIREENGVAEAHGVSQGNGFQLTNQGAPNVLSPQVRACQPSLDIQNGIKERVDGEETSFIIDASETNLERQTVSTSHQDVELPGDDSETVYQNQSQQDGGPHDDLKAPPIETLSINSQIGENPVVVPTKTLESESSMEVPPSNADTFHVKDSRSSLVGMPSQTYTSQKSPIKAPDQSISQVQTQPHLKVSQKVGFPQGISPPNDADGANWNQINYPKRDPSVQGYQKHNQAYGPNPQQQWQVHPQPQSTQAVVQSQTLMGQNYPHQNQVWQQNSEAQHASQTENKYPAAATQNQSGYHVWSMKNAHQQNISSGTQSKPSAPPMTSQIHGPTYQYPMQNSGSYGHTQNNQEYNIQMWHYYQQQQQQYFFQLQQYQLLQQQQYHHQQQQQQQEQPVTYPQQDQQQQQQMLASQSQILQQQQQPWVSQQEQSQQQLPQIPASQLQMWNNYYSQQAVPVQIGENVHYGQENSQHGVTQGKAAVVNKDETHGDVYRDQQQEASPKE